MCNKKYVLGIVVLLFMFSFVSAVPSLTQVNVGGDNGLQIYYPAFDYVPQEMAFILYLHVSNISNGFPMSNKNISCHLHLYNTTGQHTCESNLIKDANGWDHEIDLLGSNFSEVGQYSFYIWCNNSYIGGEARGTFYVTESGVEITEGRSILVVGLMAILCLFVFASLFILFSVESYMAKFISYWISHLLIVIIFFVGWQVGVEGLLGGMALTGIFRILFWIFLLAVLPMIYVSISWIVYIHTFNENFQKLIDKGADTETAFAIANKKKGWIFGN